MISGKLLIQRISLAIKRFLKLAEFDLAVFLSIYCLIEDVNFGHQILFDLILKPPAVVEYYDVLLADRRDDLFLHLHRDNDLKFGKAFLTLF